MSNDPSQKGRRWKQIGWFILIWLCSVAALGLAAAAIKWLMGLAGLTAA